MIEKIFKFINSKLRISIPNSLSMEYRNIQLTQNIQRFRITCLTLFIFNLLSFFVQLNIAPEAEGSKITSSPVVCSLYMILTAAFFVIFSSFKRKRPSAALAWFTCYAFVALVCSVQFLKIIHVTINQQPTFPFIILINLLVILPDFKPTATAIYILLVYAGAMFTQLMFLPITAFAITKMMNITIFTVICIITSVFLYIRNVQVFLNTIKLKEMNEHLSLLSTTDELTGLPNRRSFNYFYENIWSHCQRLKLPLCVIMIDIDHFKLYNDTFGHSQGDEILKTMGKHLRSCIKRETDFIARYGGEEFVGLLPYIEEQEATEFINSIMASIESLKIPAPNSIGSYLTVSIGVALSIPKVGITKELLLDCADSALYEAKKAGRNRIVFCNPDSIIP